MKKLLLMIMLSIPATSFAGWGVGGTMNTIEADTGYGDVDFQIPTIHGAYESRTDNLAYQIKLGIGLTDDSDKDDDGDAYDFEINNILQIKGMYYMSENIYAAVAYTRLDTDVYVSWEDETYSGGDNDLGFLLGYRNNNLDLYFGPSYDEDDSKIFEFGFTYFMD
jgi:hypothetical protein